MDEFLQPAQKAARQAEIDYLAALKSGPELDAELKKRVDSLFTEQMKTLAAQRGAETAAYNTAPSDARAQYADIENPLERERLVQQYTAAKLRPLIGTTTMLNAVGGTSGDILNSLMANAQGDREYKKAKMDSTSKHYESALDNFYRLAQMQQSASESAAGRNLQLALKQMEMANQVPLDINGRTYYVSPTEYYSMTGQKQSAAEKKQMDYLNSTKQFVAQMKDMFDQGGGGRGRVGGLIAGVGSGLGLNSKLNTYKKYRMGAIAALKSLYGDSGVLTDQDREYIANTLPDEKSTTQEAIDSWDMINSFIDSRIYTATGKDPYESGFQQFGF